jgi:hypothetical protein
MYRDQTVWSLMLSTVLVDVTLKWRCTGAAPLGRIHGAVSGGPGAEVEGEESRVESVHLGVGPQRRLSQWGVDVPSPLQVG